MIVVRRQYHGVDGPITWGLSYFPLVSLIVFLSAVMSIIFFLIAIFIKGEISAKRKFVFFVLCPILSFGVALVSINEYWRATGATQDDFSLYLSVDREEAVRGNNFGFELRLENTSNRSVGILYNPLMFSPHVAGWEGGDELVGSVSWLGPLPTFRLRALGHYTYEWALGRTLPTGVHEISFSARITINRRPPGLTYLFTWGRNHQSVRIESNIIQITVV